MPPQIKQQITLMVRGGQSKNDNAQIDNLFRLTSPDWVSSKESEELRETIINNEWSKSGLQSTTVEQYRVALRKWLKYEALMKEKDAPFTSLQDKEQKVCGFLHWLLDAIDLNNTDLQQKATKAPKTQLDHAIQALDT
ncbi:hypothetical protein ABBQ32_009718 [Trebouxia sp. C0010 RCD-2024]